MATSQADRDFILEQLEILPNITCRPMMGEYLLYYQDKLFGGIYDGKLLIKKTETNKIFSLEEQIPYSNAKPMYYIKELENKEILKEIILQTDFGLPKKK